MMGKQLSKTSVKQPGACGYRRRSLARRPYDDLSMSKMQGLNLRFHCVSLVRQGCPEESLCIV